MISNVAIANFKNLSRFQTDLDPINILVGANNSGKSSVLHAVHFAVSVVQSRPLLPNQFTIKPEQNDRNAEQCIATFWPSSHCVAVPATIDWARHTGFGTSTDLCA
jgi:predicted ATP-dependent endonuclease of OLD family